MIPTQKSWFILLVCISIVYQSPLQATKHAHVSYIFGILLYGRYIKDIHALTSNTYHKYDPVKPVVDTFIRSILCVYGYDLWKSVHIVHGEKFASDSIWNTIEVPLSEKYIRGLVHIYYCQIQDCTQCASYHACGLTRETLALIIGALLHEAGHLEHHDLQKWACASIITPFVIHILWHRLESYYKDISLPEYIKQNTYAWQRMLYKLCGTIFVSDTVLSYVKKYSEIQADQFAIDHINNPDILTKISNDFLTDHLYKRNKLSSIQQRIFDFFPVLYELTTRNHPSDISRMHHFKKAAQTRQKAYL